jgi:hypothetical protein
LIQIKRFFGHHHIKTRNNHHIKTLVKYCFGIATLVLCEDAFTQPTDERKQGLTCYQLLQLKDLASKKFEPTIGEKFYSDSLGIGEAFYSKQSFGLPNSTTIKTYNLDNPYVQKDEPFMTFILYLGLDTLRSMVEYLNLMEVMNECLAPLGFEKKVDRSKGGNPQFDHNVFIKETTEYHSHSYHTRFRIIFSNPTFHSGFVEARKPLKFLAHSELIEVNVFYYK